jgi:Fungal protein kinase
MKKYDDDLWDNLFEQLIEDLQSVLRMQLDRRFAFGFTFGSSQFTIWMHDRSGVLGTETSINIHKVCC